MRDALLAERACSPTKIGGPSVFPPQPAGVTTEAPTAPLHWNVSTGEDRYRRSLYTFTKRTAPFAMFATFDAPSGEACVARREVSNTPLQALTLLNDPVFVEAAQALGRTHCGATRSDASDDRRASGTVPPLPDAPAETEELSVIVAVQFAAQQRRRFARRKELDAGEHRRREAGDDANERAAWTTARPRAC